MEPAAPAVGAKVLVCGLAGSSHLNGARATVEAWEAEAERWVVRLDIGRQVRVKAENMCRPTRVFVAPKLGGDGDGADLDAGSAKRPRRAAADERHPLGDGLAELVESGEESAQPAVHAADADALPMHGEYCYEESQENHSGEVRKGRGSLKLEADGAATLSAIRQGDAAEEEEVFCAEGTWSHKAHAGGAVVVAIVFSNIVRDGRPEPWPRTVVEVDQSEGRSLGVDVDLATLEIRAVHEKGAFWWWLREGQRWMYKDAKITEANKKFAPRDIAEELGRRGKLAVTVVQETAGLELEIRTGGDLKVVERRSIQSGVPQDHTYWRGRERAKLHAAAYDV